MAKAKIVYSPHPSLSRIAGWQATLHGKTGRSFDEWMAFIQSDGPAGIKERREWLKNELGLQTTHAWWLAERSCGLGGEEDTPEGYLKQAEIYVKDMFAPKPDLMPLYEKLIAVGKSLGKDVIFCPCKTIVPFYRKHVFAEVKPSTKKRIDFGLALGDTQATGKLVDTGGFAKKDRITHRIAVCTLDDIDEELIGWARAAYKRDE